MSNTSFSYRIRPAARLVHTIGSDLIGDAYAALVELVKNSYDADSTRVDINFNYKKIDKKDALVITVSDDGHGMSLDTIVNKWLVPATDDKLQRKYSPNRSRSLQGRKGIGRFAASILGQEMTLSSVSANKEKSTAVIDWRLFKSNEFLENIELLVESETTEETPGTVLEIVAKNEADDYKISTWDKKSVDALINELRKLISPFEEFNNDQFNINLSFTNSPFADINKEISIETYPVIDLYDYRISGSISKSGEAQLVFVNNINPDIKQTEAIDVKYILEDGGEYCGDLKIDFRVFDREPEAIDNLIDKGLIDPITQKYMGKNDARRLLNEVYGVNIYKNFFRIRPYGNAGVDWLKLDNRRIQNPTQRISNNQIVGFITIQREEFSKLEEKSARDGLKENKNFNGLIELADKALSELERRRFIYRVKSEKSRGKKNTIKDSIDNLFSLSDVKTSISKKLTQLNIDNATIGEINTILKNEEDKKVELKEELEKTIAIYQGQATLGKIVNFILHEGRKPLQFFNSETKVLERYIEFYKSTKDESILSELNNSIKGFKTNSKLISSLFKRINPLAKQKRGNRKNFIIKPIINDSYEIFKSTLSDLNIAIVIELNSDIEIYGWSEDLFTALTNLIENSIYWLNISEQEKKCITIRASEDNDSVIIDCLDNGPGLSSSEIESDIIFEPGYTKKINGTGLGLAIAGEAIERFKGKLKARKNKNGAYFQIEINK